MIPAEEKKKSSSKVKHYSEPEMFSTGKINPHQIKSKAIRKAHYEANKDRVRQPSPSKNQFQRQIVQKEAELILEEARKMKSENITIESLEKDILEMKFMEENKEVQYPYRHSTSSDQELTPIYPTEAEIISMATDNSEQTQFYIVCRILMKKNQVLQEEIVKIKTLTNDIPEPAITKSFQSSSFIVYKIKVSSGLRKFELKLKVNNNDYRSNPMTYSKGKIFEFGKFTHYDFNKNQELPLTVFEEFLVFACSNVVKEEELKEQVLRQRDRFFKEDLEIKRQIQILIQATQNRSLFYEIMFLLIPENQHKISSPLLNIFTAAAEIETFQHLRKDIALKVIEKFIQILIKTQKKEWKYILGQKKSKKVLYNILSYFKSKKLSYELFSVVEKYCKNKLGLLAKMNGLDTFVIEIVRNTGENIHKIQQIQILSLYYFVMIRSQSDRVEQKFISAFSINKIDYRDIKNVENYIKDIITNQKIFFHGDVKPETLFYLLKIYDCFPQVIRQHFPTQKIKRRINFILQRQMKNPYALKTLHLLYIGNFPLLIENNSVQKKLSTFLTNKDFYKNDQLMKSMNEFFILPLLRENKIDKVKKQYMDVLKKKIYILTSSLSVLNAGLTDQMLMDEEFVKNFNKLINDLIKTHLNDEHFLDHMDSWHNCFKYHNHINEILVDRFVDRMTQLETDPFEITNKYRKIQEKINQHTQGDTKDILSTIVWIKEKGQITIEIIMQFLLQNKSMLNTLCVIKSKKNQAKKLEVELKKIEGHINQISYRNLQKILKMNEKDKRNFEKLFGENVLRSLSQKLKALNPEIEKVRGMLRFITTMQDKYSVIDNKKYKQRLEDIQEKLYDLKLNQGISGKLFSSLFPTFRTEIIFPLYHYEFFYQNCDLRGVKIEKIQEITDKQINLFFKTMLQIFEGIQKKQVLKMDYDYFKFEQIPEDELKKILNIAKERGINKCTDKNIKQLCKIIKNNKKIDIYASLASAFLYFAEEDKAFKSEFQVDLVEIVNVAKKMSMPDSNEEKIIVVDETQIIINLLKKLKISLNEDKFLKQINSYLNKGGVQKTSDANDDNALLIAMIVTWKNHQVLQNMKSLTQSLQIMKEKIRERYDEKITLKTKDFIQFERVIKYYIKAVEKKRKVSDYLEYLRKQISNQFVSELISITNKYEEFQFFNQQIKKPHYEQAISIFKIVENSELRISITEETYKGNFILVTKILGKDKETDEIQLISLKDEALLNLSKLKYEQNSSKTEKQKNQRFLEIAKIFQEIKYVQNNLLTFGYIFFKDYKAKLSIRNGNLQNLNEYYLKRKQILSVWKSKLQNIYDYSQKATMLKGRKMKQFFYFLLEKQIKGENKFRYIVDTETLKSFKNTKKIEYLLENTAFDCLEKIESFFEFIKKKVQVRKEKAKDRDIQFCQILKFSEKDCDYTYSLSQIDKDKLSRMSQGSILSCNGQTSIEQIESFMERTRNVDQQFIIMGYQNLSFQKQNIIINMVEKLMNEKQLKIKICLVGDTERQKIFKYFNSKMPVRKNIELHQLASPTKQYKKFIEQRLGLHKNTYGKVKIFKSVHEGLGKTYSIEQQLSQKGLQPKYFPISGRIKTERIYSRLKQKTQNSKKFGLIIQLYNIDKQSVKIVNNFITQIILWRSFSYKSQYCCFDISTPIYIEYQNITQLKEKQKDELTFLKKIEEQYSEQVVQVITGFSKIKIKESNKKLLYILEHLNIFHEGTLDKKSTQVFNKQYNPQKIPNNAHQLLDEYFVRRIKKKSFHLFNAWVKIFFESCQAFSACPNLNLDLLNDPSVYPQKQKQKLKINSIRSDFFKVLHKNTLDFLEQGIQDEKQQIMGSKLMQQANLLTEKLRDFPFFIVPNTDKQSFSFIYRRYDQIPPVVQLFMISQTTQFIKTFQKKDLNNLVQQILGKCSLNILEQKQDLKEFYEEINKILINISGNKFYDVLTDANYTMNLDNFFKICLLSYRMNANLPIIVQGQAGVGKTALLRHMTQKIFKYKFLPFNINAGITQEKLLKYLDDIHEETQKKENENLKICVFFDEFNTLPQLGYFSELIIQRKFQGQKKNFLEKVVPMGACNPYRNIIKKKVSKQEQAYHVLPPPLSMTDFKWNFGNLKQLQMKKYIKHMLIDIYKDLNDLSAIETVFNIQKSLQDREFGSVSLRDVQRVKQLYKWLKANLPNVANIPVPKQIVNHYSNKNIRSFIFSLMLTFYVRRNSTAKRQTLLNIIDEKFRLQKKSIIKFKEFEEDDFCSRLTISDSNISLNRSLKQNIFTLFISINKKIPIILIGDPGCSKSLAARIVTENLKNIHNNNDIWLKKFRPISDFPFQGSITCKSNSVEKLFQKAKRSQQEENRLGNEIPFILFDEIGLAQESKDNPLKVLHPYLETYDYEQGKTKERDIAFLGISNQPLDVSKMSRFLILWRPKMQKDDLETTSLGISEGMLKNSGDLKKTIQPYLKRFSSCYFQFIGEWQKYERDLKKNFFGLRDFYNLIKTFIDLIIKGQIKSCEVNKIQEAANRAIFRNFSGRKNSFQIFKKFFYQRLQFEANNFSYNVLDQVMYSIQTIGKRFPLIIVPDQISEIMLRNILKNKFKNYLPFRGSQFENDNQNNPYILKSLTTIVRSTEQEKVLVASNLNHTIQTALFDLFNKFFIKRGGQQYYRVGLESGFMFTQVINPKFNCAVIMNMNDIGSVSGAFLNRFEKYEYHFNQNKEGKQKDIEENIKNFTDKIIKICIQNELSHYKMQHLFANSSEIAIKTLISKKIMMSEENEQQNLIRQCLRELILLSTRDFQQIFKILIQPKQLLDKDMMLLVNQQIKKKKQILQKEKGVVVYSSDKDLWRKEVKDKTKIINIEYIKTEDELQKQIETFFDSNTQQTLHFDIEQEFKGNIEYLINKIQDIRKRSKIQSKINVQVDKKCRINMKYDRRKDNSAISCFLSYSIIFYDGDNKIDNNNSSKEQVFQDINMAQLIKTSLQLITFKYSEETQKQIDEFESIIKNKLKQQIIRISLYPKHCIKAITTLEGSEVTIDDDKILKAMKNEESFQRYRNIQTIITKLYFEDKFKAPIVIFTDNIIKNDIFLCYSTVYRAQIFNKIINESHTNKISLMLKLNDQEKYYQQYLTALVEEKIRNEKLSYTNLKRLNRLKINNLNRQVTIGKPTFFPNSKQQIKLILQNEQGQGENSMITLSKKISNITDENEYENEFRQFCKIYQSKTKLIVNKDRKHYTYINNSKEIKHLLFIDILIAFLQKQNMNPKHVLVYERQLCKFLSVQDSIPFIVCVLLGNQELWLSIFKILQSFCNHSGAPFTLVHSQLTRDASLSTIIDWYKMNFLSTLKSHFKFNGEGLAKFKNNENVFHKVFMETMQELQILNNAKIFKNKQIQQYKLQREFFLFWETLTELYPDGKLDLKDYFDEEGKKYDKIYNFLKKVHNQRPDAEKLIFEYYANKLFYEWFSSNDFKIKQFLYLCDSSEAFCHNSINTMNKVFSGAFNYSMKIQKNVSKYNTRVQNMKAIKDLGQKCKQKQYKNNLSILLCNIFYGQLEMQKAKQAEKNRLQFLKNQFSEFSDAVNCLTNSQYEEVFKIYLFALVKFYLFVYVQVVEEGVKQEVMEKIDKKLCEKTGISNDLRFYCLRLFRKKMTVKELHQKYYKIPKLDWTQQLRQEMKEEEAKAIMVPCTPENVDRGLIDKIQAFKKSDGKQVKLIDEIVELGGQSMYNKYAMLNMFTSFIYPKAYNHKQYQNNIIDHIKNNRGNYLNHLKQPDYQLIIRYCIGKFDENLFTNTYKQFNQEQILILNNLNWLTVSSTCTTPFHSLFYNNGNIHDSIYSSIKSSFLPCGRENPFIVIASATQKLTRNNNIGVYLCSSSCDYIYSHGDCGWPNQTRDCPICKEKIGSGGTMFNAHKLSRSEKGAKRIISEKFVDAGSDFYIGKFSKLQSFWQAQRLYIEAEIIRMRQKKQVTIPSQTIKNKQKKQVEVKDEKTLLTGYFIDLNNDRISIITSKIIGLCLDSAIYCFISMGSFPQHQAKQMLDLKPQQQPLKYLFEKINGYINDLKAVVNLDNKFYGWIFGMQRIIFEFLMNFPKQAEIYTKKLQEKENVVSRKLKEEVQKGLLKKSHIDLFRDLQVSVIGMVSKRYKALLTGKQFTAKNQFSRNIFQSFVEENVQKYLHQNKMQFANENYVLQGAMQFPFDISLTQAKVDSNFSYCQILKVPSHHLKVQNIIDTYEIVIKDKFPYLDYIIKNISTFSQIREYNKAISFINQLTKIISHRKSRKQCESLTLLQISKQFTQYSIKSNLVDFIGAWKRLSKFLGTIQIQCKIYGTMNDDLNESSPVKNFILQRTIKNNAAGMIITGIYHNYAITQNQSMTVMNARKNRIAKYRALQLVVDSRKINPQHLQKINALSVQEREVNKKLTQRSIRSVRYGDNTIFHNFDSCENELLYKLKGISEIQSNIQKYDSILYVGQAFGKLSPYSDAIIKVRQKFHTQLERDKKQSIRAKLDQVTQTDELICLKGALQKTIIKVSQVYQLKDQGLWQFKVQNESSLLKMDPFYSLKLSEVVSCFEFLEEKMHEYTIEDIHEWYTCKIQKQAYRELVTFFQSLPTQDSQEQPTISQAKDAICRFVYRNLLCESFPKQQKIMEFVISKQDFWPNQYQYDEKGYALVSNEILANLTMQFGQDLAQLVYKVEKKMRK